MQKCFDDCVSQRWRQANQALQWTMAFTLSAVAYPASASGEPTIPVPPDARRFDVAAESIKVNGLPTRINGFVSTRPHAELAKWYRQQLGEPLAENRLGNRQILGKERDGHYITVQLEPVDDGTRGVVSVASLQDIQRHHEAELAARERWQNRLPAGSRLLSHVGSTDAGQAATFIAFVNRHDESVNQAGLRQMLREEGLEMERAAGAGTETAGQHAGTTSGTTMYFKGAGREALATVFRTGDAQTAVILNITTATGSGQ